MRFSNRTLTQATILAAWGVVACTGSGVNLTVSSTPGSQVTPGDATTGGARIDQIAAGQRPSSAPQPGVSQAPGTATPIPTPTPVPTAPPPPPEFTVALDRSLVPPILEMPFQLTPSATPIKSGDNPDSFTFTGLATKLVGREVVATRDVLVWSVRREDGGDASPYVTASGSTTLVGIATGRFTLTTRATGSVVTPVNLRVEAVSGSVRDSVTFAVGNGNNFELTISGLRGGKR